MSYLYLSAAYSDRLILMPELACLRPARQKWLYTASSDVYVSQLICVACT